MSWLIATDLDGTLLDDDYDLMASADALNRQIAQGREVALASSKTFSEMWQLAALCDREPTLIFENGAGLAWPERLWRKSDAGPVRGSYRISIQGDGYVELIAMLRSLRQSGGAHYRGFSDMSVAEIAGLTGLSTSGANRARERQASEPIRWLDSAAALASFEQSLQRRGYRLVQGGRFHHVMPRTDKACAVVALSGRLAERDTASVRVLCCGDSANDRAMLRCADVAVVFPRPDGSLMAPDQNNASGSCRPSVVCHAAGVGAEAWSRAVAEPLHRATQALHEDLQRFAMQRPMSLVLPCLYSELQHPALTGILEQLQKVPYLAQVVIGLDRASESEYRHALEFFSRLPQPHAVLWNDGPRLRVIQERLADLELAPLELGKRCNVWYCFGYVQATGVAEAVALHDCDITTYHRDMLARLLYPVANPQFNYQFCKGYYARVADNRLNGRVSRLLVSPLIRTLKKVSGEHPFLSYLDSFRYPLAGEFSMRMEALKDLRIPSDWGLEIGVLSEVYRNYSTNRLCQVEIADTYDHKHQELSADDESGGLSRMSLDISKSLFRKLATYGAVFDPGTVRSVKAAYFRIALDLIESYSNDALMNGLHLDRHSEEHAVELFARNRLKAGESFLESGDESPFMPAWNRVTSVYHDVFTDLVAAVEADSREFGAPSAQGRAVIG